MKNKRTCDYIAEAIQNEILSGRMEQDSRFVRRNCQRNLAIRECRSVRHYRF